MHAAEALSSPLSSLDGDRLALVTDGRVRFWTRDDVRAFLNCGQAEAVAKIYTFLGSRRRCRHARILLVPLTPRCRMICFTLWGILCKLLTSAQARASLGRWIATASCIGALIDDCASRA